MSQIKSYISLESVPSLEFKTPPKNMLYRMPTNNSMTCSNTLGSSDYKSLWNRRTFYNSQELSKEPNYQSRDFVEQVDGEIENNSSAVTLSPVVTPTDMIDLVNAVKMVAFLTQKTIEDKKRIEVKATSILGLKNKIAELEENVNLTKKSFQKKEKIIKSRSLSVRKMRQSLDKDIHKQVLDLKININKIKKTLSVKKGTVETKRSSNQKRKQEHASEQQSNKKKLYVPIVYSPSFFPPQQYYPSTRHSSHSTHSSHPLSYPNIQPKYINHQLAQRPIITHTSSNHLQRPPSGRNSKNSQPAYPLINGKGKELDGNQILGLIQQKLKTPSNSISRLPSAKTNVQIKPNSEQLPQKKSSIFEMLAPALNKEVKPSYGSYKINILKEQEDRHPNLDQFDDSFQKELDMHQQKLLNSQKSRKSIKPLKQSSTKSINKWIKDEQDHEIIELLCESMRSSNKKILQADSNSLKAPQRSDIGDKMVVTNIKHEDSFDIDHLPDTSRDRAKQSPIANSSHIDIFVADNSEDKSKNSSIFSEKEKKLSANSRPIDRENIVNSVIGIEIIDSMDEIPHNPDEPTFSPKRMAGLAVRKQIEKIEEMSDEGISRCDTPVDFKLTHHLEPSVESGYMPAPRDIISALIANSQGSMEKSSGPQTPILSRPPSLIEQEEEEEEDNLESIKLHTESKFSSEPRSKVIRQSLSIEFERKQEEAPAKSPSGVEQDDDDFLQEIHLPGLSKISREKKENLQARNKDSDIVPTPSQGKMAKSDLSPSSNFNQREGMEIIDSELRKSTSSVIMKQGSAISRSRKESSLPKAGSGSGLKSSNQSIMLSGTNSNLLSSAIAEAEEEEEDQQTVRKHRRNGTTPQS